MIKRRYTIILSIISFLSASLLLGIPFVSKYLVNEAILLSKIADKNYSKITMYIILAISFGVTSVLFRFLYNNLFSSFSLRVEENIKNKLYSSLVYKDINEINKYHIGELDALFHKDIDNISHAYLESIPNIVRQASRCLIAFIMLIIIDTSKWFILGVIILGICAIIFSYLYTHFVRPRHKNVLEADNKSSSFVVETINAGSLIQSYDAMERASNYYESLNKEATKAKKSRNRIVVGANSLVFAITNLTYVFALSLGGYFIAKDIITYGALVALIQLLNNIEYPFLTIPSYLNKYSLGKVSNQRVLEMINLKEIDKDTIIPNFDEIVFDNVTYSYDNDNNIIQDFNFVIKKGNKVRISGPSGIGKTTIFMLILGFIKPNKGSIYFNYSGKKYQANYNTRGLISYVSQETILFSGSILDNIKILTGIDDIEKINESLKLVNLYDEINKMKNGLNTILRDKGEGLSKGQVQRLLIAISILYDKPIMMLDEFSSALDKDNEKKIIDNLSNLNKTIIFISHKDVLVSSDVNIKLGE